MDWLYYLLEANLYLLLFYGFYRLFLQNETFYNSNRYFLLLTSITAFILPIMQLGFLKPAPIVDNALFPPPILYTDEQLAKMTFAPAQETFSLTDWFYPIYLIIALGFAIKLSISLFKIIRLWLKAKKAKTGKITLIELKEQTTAFSFFNLLFIHPHLAEKQTILNHEMVHIKQKHSVDILFFEILQIICWFNPIIYFIKKDIKLLHEYIADELSTNSGIQKHEYAMFLIENSFGVIPTPLTNQIFNQSILKRRINMLNKKRTADWARLRLLLTLPLVGAMLCTSTMAFTKDYGYVDLLPEKSKVTEAIQQEAPQVKEVKHTAPKAKTVKKDQVKFPPPVVQASGSDRFSPMYRRDKKTGKPVLAETRLIVINGKPIEDLTKFYGISNAKSVYYRSKPNSLAKYGDKGKDGAVEITGNDIKYFTEVTLPSTPPVEPPPPRQDQVKFPPPIVKPDKANDGEKPAPQIKKAYFPPYKRDKDDKYISLEKRAIIYNGNVIVDKNQYYGTNDADKIIYLNSADAIAKYGEETGKFGAIEITGEKAVNAFPPPIVKQDQVKFPPPIVKSDKKKLKTSTVAPRPPEYKQREKAPRVVEKRNITGVTKREIDSSTNRLTGTIGGYQVDRKNEVSRIRSVYGIGKTGNISGISTNKNAISTTNPSVYGIGSQGNANSNATGATTIYKIDSLQKKNN